MLINTLNRPGSQTGFAAEAGYGLSWLNVGVGYGL
jgi:hypothetical protein